MSDAYETIRLERDGSGLARLTLDRPEAMNGMTNRMVREATAAAGVFPDETFRADADEVAQGLLAKSPTALAALKQNYLVAEGVPFSEFVRLEAGRHLEIAASEDTAEAFRAFVEKRPPVFPSLTRSPPLDG